MKKKLLSMAVVAAFAGGATTAQAVNVNPDGLGQVLMFPFYSAEGGNDTYINIANTTGDTKAIKVRFIEGMNSVEVLDFNLYLSPFDHWSAVVTRGAGEAAIIRTWDESCTVPNIPAGGEAFRNSEYQGDGAPYRGLDRTREGYVEIIEMGVLDPAGSLAPNAIHDNTGVPADCGALDTAWRAGGTWAGSSSAQMLPPSGGLYGYGVLINVDEGTNATYSATAIDGFSDIEIHRAPGDELPNLDTGNVGTANVFDNGQVVTANFIETIDAVSAVMMKEYIVNDFMLDPGVDGGTDWVVTFPTKRAYNGSAPFTTAWDSTNAEACEPIDIAYYDREERTTGPGPVDFSPAPSPGTNDLCREVNVITFNNSDVLEASDRIRYNLNVIYDNGWMRLGLNNSTPNATQTPRVLSSADGVDFFGLPVIGFAVQKFVNGDVGGLMSNYAGLIDHKGARLISSND